MPIWTKPKHAHYLSFHLVRDGINGTPIVFPVVAKGEDRVRIFMHAHNTEEDVRHLVKSITDWADEMMEIERSGDKNKLPSAARLAFDLIGKEDGGVNEANGTNGANGANGAKKVSGTEEVNGAQEMKTNGVNETKGVNGMKVVFNGTNGVH